MNLLRYTCNINCYLFSHDCMKIYFSPKIPHANSRTVILANNYDYSKLQNDFIK